jgi:hypothetical protein
MLVNYDMKKSSSVVRKITFLFFLFFSVFLIYTNIKLYANHFSKQEKIEDIICQLNFLEHELKDKDLGRRMQNIYPEGLVFTNSLYGLSWCELGLADTSQLKKERALKEAIYAYNNINTEDAKSVFSSTLGLENGIFYVGWNNYLLSNILLLDSNFENSQHYKDIYFEQCEEISEALAISKSPFLESYPKQSWPADMFVAMASINNYKNLYGAKYKSMVADWIEIVKTKVDPKTMLVPHKVNSLNGASIEGARGCSISLILRLLSEIDMNFARKQYLLYQGNFVSTTFGLPSIREFPKGEIGFGDIDSGPVIFGIGFAGTIVSIGTHSVLGDFESSENQYNTINSFGFGSNVSKSKKYVLGLLPIADAFVAWSRSSALKNTENKVHESNFWAVEFHLITILFLVLIWDLFFLSTRIKK